MKCANEGVNSTCKACATTNRHCQYPPSGETSTPQRYKSTANIKQGDSESNKRDRKVKDSRWRNTACVEDPLESPVLTRKVSDEL